MTFAADMLASAQESYATALKAKEKARFRDREVTERDLDKLLSHVNHWQSIVDAETARAAGKSSRAPLRFRL